MEKLSRFQKILGIALLLFLAVSITFAAEEGQRQRGQRGGQNGQRMQRDGRGGFDPAAMQERMMNMMQERMGASDEEWTVIKPRLSKVMDLNMDVNVRGRGMRGMFGRGRGNRGPQGQTANDEDASAIEKASTEFTGYTRKRSSFSS